jgi:hypothetical protein
MCEVDEAYEDFGRNARGYRDAFEATMGLKT